jgi:DNA polymerase-3 subunit epsilon
MPLPLTAPLRTAEYLAIDTETNGFSGSDCELTEVGCVLVGGGECHDEWESLVAVRAALGPGIQRFTGITQAMVDCAPDPAAALPELARRMEGRVLVAHNASFDKRVLSQAFARAGLAWPDPPVLCTVALARRLLPLQRRRGLGVLAGALGLEPEAAHRALVDARTCAQVFCAMFARLCANAGTVAEALELFGPRRRAARPREPGRVRRARGTGSPASGGALAITAARAVERLDFKALPTGPGVYIFRDEAGRVLYVGKSVSLRARARAHFAGGEETAPWTAQAHAVDHRSTRSELGALLLEHRMIRADRPPGNVALKRYDDRLVYVRCRLDIAYPILEVAREPAPGHAVSIGPLRGRAAAAELVEHLNSLYGLRRCGRSMPKRYHPSAYGQMGRCLSPCLGDLDPNLYRARLDAALEPFTSGGNGATRLLAQLEAMMRAAAQEQRFERAAVLRRRRARVGALIERMSGALRAVHTAPRLVLATHPRGGGLDALWLVGGRVVGWEELADSGAGAGGGAAAGPRLAATVEALATRSAAARAAAPRSLAAASPSLAGSLSPDEAVELRIIESWLASHEDTPVIPLDRSPDRKRLARAVARAA